MKSLFTVVTIIVNEAKLARYVCRQKTEKGTVTINVRYLAQEAYR
jgi:hypothetical protein